MVQPPNCVIRRPSPASGCWDSPSLPGRCWDSPRPPGGCWDSPRLPGGCWDSPRLPGDAGIRQACLADAGIRQARLADAGIHHALPGRCWDSPRLFQAGAGIEPGSCPDQLGQSHTACTVTQTQNAVNSAQRPSTAARHPTSTGLVFHSCSPILRF